MSRAFVNEDAFIEELPDRPISVHPNLVTVHGLRLIEKALEEARHAYGRARRPRIAKPWREVGATCATGMPVAQRRNFARRKSARTPCNSATP